MGTPTKPKLHWTGVAPVMVLIFLTVPANAGPVKGAFRLERAWFSGHSTRDDDGGSLLVGDEMWPENEPLCRRLLDALNQNSLAEASKSRASANLPPSLIERGWRAIAITKVAPEFLKADKTSGVNRWALEQRNLDTCRSGLADGKPIGCEQSAIDVINRQGVHTQIGRTVYRVGKTPPYATYDVLNGSGELLDSFTTGLEDFPSKRGTPGFRVFRFEGADYLGHWGYEDYDFSVDYGRPIHPAKRTFEVEEVTYLENKPFGMKVCVFSLIPAPKR